MEPLVVECLPAGQAVSVVEEQKLPAGQIVQVLLERPYSDLK
jgi:hypothetical protein